MVAYNITPDMTKPGVSLLAFFNVLFFSIEVMRKLTLKLRMLNCRSPIHNVKMLTFKTSNHEHPPVTNTTSRQPQQLLVWLRCGADECKMPREKNSRTHKVCMHAQHNANMLSSRGTTCLQNFLRIAEASEDSKAFILHT